MKAIKIAMWYARMLAYNIRLHFVLTLNPFAWHFVPFYRRTAYCYHVVSWLFLAIGVDIIYPLRAPKDLAVPDLEAAIDEDGIDDPDSIPCEHSRLGQDKYCRDCGLPASICDPDADTLPV